jgi:hypothetical protein
MRKKKTSLDLMKEIRTTWSINPITRVHDNDIRKSKKKLRNEGKKETKKALGEDPGAFLSVCSFISWEYPLNADFFFEI